MKLYRHIKSGDIYELLHEAIECTNDRTKNSSFKPSVAVYRHHNSNSETIFVRDLDEFVVKFEELKDGSE